MTFPLQRSGNGKRVIDKSVVFFNCKLYRRHRKQPAHLYRLVHFISIYIADYTLIKYLYLNIVPVICMDSYGCSLLTNLASVSFCILEIVFYLWWLKIHYVEAGDDICRGIICHGSEVQWNGESSARSCYLMLCFLFVQDTWILHLMLHWIPHITSSCKTWLYIRCVDD